MLYVYVIFPSLDNGNHDCLNALCVRFFDIFVNRKKNSFSVKLVKFDRSTLLKSK